MNGRPELDSAADPGPLKRRLSVATAVCLVALAVLGLRLAHLQVLRGAYWSRLAENNRLRKFPVEPRRGRIFDRTGAILADNEASYRLLLFAAEAEDLDRTRLFLAKLGVASREDLRRRFELGGAQPAAPKLVSNSATWDQVCAVRARQLEFPELVIVPAFRRVYPQRDLCAHAIGYVRPPTAGEVEEDPGLWASVPIGATGVERAWNGRLMGAPGRRTVVVDATGQQLGEVDTVPSVAGEDLTVTLDLRLQRAAARSLGDRRGAVVALEPDTGAVRVLYSSPSFDPNVFTGGLSMGDWVSLRDDPLHPLQDRAVQGEYPPGSTIKPFLALAGLHEGLITPADRVRCQGRVVLYGHPFRCWQAHGVVDLEEALERSCDTYFYLLGQRLGIERIAGWLRRFGFGAPTGLDPSRERSGLVGDPRWVRETRGHPWYPGTTISVSIGQGPVLTTPLQLARAFAALADEGRLRRPRLVAVAPEQLEDPRRIPLEPDELRVVAEGLKRVVSGRRGTARRLSPLPVAGKTGTAQVVRLQEDVDMSEVEKRYRHHALFVGWAPADSPRLVVAVVVEHGGGGAEAAAPVAGDVLRAALRLP